jgi:hypothetical protein
LAAWIKTSYTDWVWRRIFDKGTGKGYDLTMAGDDKGIPFRGQVCMEAGKAFVLSGIQVADGRWHQVVGTFDGADAKVYVDGRLAGTPKHRIGNLAHTPYDLTIGANRSNPDGSLGEIGASFNGEMDDVMMFNRALSTDEVQTLFKSQGGVLAPQAAQLSPAAGTQSGPSAPAANATDLKYGLFIHFGMDTFRYAGEKGQLPVERFAPASVDVNAWVHAAKEAGMTFATLTVKHESGFCLWDSQGCDYDIAHSPFQGDLLADFIAACKAEDIVPGFHYTIQDAYNEGSIRYKGGVPPPYFNIIKQHLTELNTKYPELRILVLDLSERLSPGQFQELSRIVERINPQCALWNTTGGDRGPHQVEATVIHSWMWAPNAQLNPALKLFSDYQQCQAAGKAFELAVGPMPSGNIPANQLAVLMQIKDMIAGDRNH